MTQVIIAGSINFWEFGGLGWDEFDLLELATTPTGYSGWLQNGLLVDPIPIYGNMSALGTLGLPMDTDWPTLLDRISGVITKILRQANDCSNFFNNSPVVQTSGMLNGVTGNGPATALDFYNSDNLVPMTTLNGVPYPNDTGAATNENTGANSPISINANPSGAFLNQSMGSVGNTFPTGSLAGQVTMILHELAHTLAAVPPDSGSATESEGNTDTVLAHCKKAIQAAVKSVAH